VHGVAVPLCETVGDGVEVVADGPAGEDEDIIGQAAVDRAVEALVGGAGCVVGTGEGGGLRLGVDAGVGAAGALDEHRRPDDAPDGSLDDLLHRAESQAAGVVLADGFGGEGVIVGDILSLPAVEVRPVVGDGEAVAGHAGDIIPVLRGKGQRGGLAPGDSLKNRG